MFRCGRSYQTAFQCGCTVVHSHQQEMRVSVALQPCQHLVFSIFAILIGMWKSVSYSCFSLQLPSFHMLICHLYIFFDEGSVWMAWFTWPVWSFICSLSTFFFCKKSCKNKSNICILLKLSPNISIELEQIFFFKISLITELYKYIA